MQICQLYDLERDESWLNRCVPARKFVLSAVHTQTAFRTEPFDFRRSNAACCTLLGMDRPQILPVLQIG